MEFPIIPVGQWPKIILQLIGKETRKCLPLPPTPGLWARTHSYITVEGDSHILRHKKEDRDTWHRAF